jgi:ferredoxin
MAQLRVTIDRDECISCAQCWETCPTFFDEAEDGWSEVTLPFRAASNAEGKAPAELEGCVTEAAEGCPVDIIHVVPGA